MRTEMRQSLVNLTDLPMGKNTVKPQLLYNTVLGVQASFRVSYPNHGTVMVLNFRTDIPGQTVQAQIRLLLKEQSDQGLHCLPFCLLRLDALFYGRAT